LIIGILSIGTFLSTRQFYTELSTPTRTIEVTNNLLQTVDTASSSKISIGGNSTISNHLRVQQKDDDDAKHLPIAEELFEGANDNTDDGEKIISIAKNEDEDRDLPITEELFEVVANNYTDVSVDNVTNLEYERDMINQGNESSSGEGGEQISSGKIIEETEVDEDEVDDNETSSNAKDEEEEESCFRPRRYNKSKSRLSTPCEFVY